MSDIAFKKIYDLIDGSDICCLAFQPGMSNFTIPYNNNLILFSNKGMIEVKLKDIRLSSLHSFLNRILFSTEKILLTWNIKEYFSYLKFWSLSNSVNVETDVRCNLLDLKYISSYCGFKDLTCPTTFRQWCEILAKLSDIEGWRKIYDEMHVPLALKVLPYLETIGFRQSSEIGAFYTSYDIEGQTNGRLSVHKISSNFISLHTISVEDRKGLRPLRDGEMVCVSLDYQHMEVSMLQWLSGDVQLGDDLKKGPNFYADLIDGNMPDQDKKKLGKATFIPVIYGMQPSSLAKNFNISERDADSIIGSMKEKYVTAFGWLRQKQEEPLIDGMSKDILGRHRNFNNEPSYKLMNFHVQSPAATFCLLKLVDLYQECCDNLWYNIHDGYALFCCKQEALSVIKKARDVLVKELDSFSGLKMSVGCEII